MTAEPTDADGKQIRDAITGAGCTPVPVVRLVLTANSAALNFVLPNDVLIRTLGRTPSPGPPVLRFKPRVVPSWLLRLA